MPMYDYRCKACGARFEAWQKFSDDPISVCPTCSGPAQRVIHAAGIMFKGSGFYSTDHKSGAAQPPSEGAEAGAKSGETPADKPAEKAAETPKPAATSATASAPASAPAASGASAPAAQAS